MEGRLRLRSLPRSAIIDLICDMRRRRRDSMDRRVAKAAAESEAEQAKATALLSSLSLSDLQTLLERLEDGNG